MDFTLDQLLTIIGRLDDTPGFDTPRERFRRLLDERMTSLESTRGFIQQCRERSGEQSHRALQDAVVLAGRFLGFDVGFGPYQHAPGVAPAHGTWVWRRRLTLTIVVCTDQTGTVDVDALSRAVAEDDDGTPRIGLLVLTSFYVGRDALQKAMATGSCQNLRLVTLNGLLRICAMVADGRLGDDDVLQLLNPAISLDAWCDLLERVATVARPEAPVGMTPPEPEPGGRRYWVNAMRPDPFMPAERIVRSLVGTREILGINPAPGLEDHVRTGDAICVFVVGRGVVAHAQIAAVLTDGSRMIRDPKRFTHVLRLTNVTVYDAPVVPSQELAHRLDLALSDDVAAVTVPVSPREFESITILALSEAG